MENSIGLNTETNPNNNTSSATDVKKIRDNYMVEMRKQDRMQLINKRRYYMRVLKNIL